MALTEKHSGTKKTAAQLTTKTEDQLTTKTADLNNGNFLVLFLFLIMSGGGFHCNSRHSTLLSVA